MSAKSFNAIHPTIGAGIGFVVGKEGCDASIQDSSGKSQSLGFFVGVRQEPSLPWRMLPLFMPGVPPGDEMFEILTGARYGRTFALASDRWLIGPLVFKLCTPFWKTSDPGGCERDVARLHFAPSIGGFVEYDNTHSEEPVEVMVGFGAEGAGFRPTGSGIRGFVSANHFGFGTTGSGEVRLRLGASPFAEAQADAGDCASLVFTIPAGTKRIFPFATGFQESPAGPASHSQLFSGIEDVIAASLAANSEIVRRSDELDAAWFGGPGSREDKVAHAHLVRQYLAESRVDIVGGDWTLVRPENDGRSAFDAEFFPWAGVSSDL